MGYSPWGHKESDTTEQLSTDACICADRSLVPKKVPTIYIKSCLGREKRDIHKYMYTYCLVTSVVSDSVQPYGLQLVRLLCPCNSLGKKTGVDCHFFPQGIKPGFPTLQADSLLSEPLGKPRIYFASWLLVLISVILEREGEFIKIQDLRLWENRDTGM